jgi:hypothetical protein
MMDCVSSFPFVFLSESVKMSRNYIVALFAGLSAVIVAASAHGAVFNQNPYGNYIGTGTASANGGGTSSWSDQNTHTTNFTTSPPLFYQETYATGRPLGHVIVEPYSRQVSGDIYVATSLAGPLTTPYASFSLPGFSPGMFSNPVGNIFGVRVEATGTTAGDGNRQIAGAEFLTLNPGPNVALGMANVASAGSILSGSVTNGMYDRSWRASSAADNQFVGFQFGDTEYLKALRITTSSPDAIAFAWNNFQVELLQDGNWNPIGQANLGGSQDILWIDLEEGMFADGVRLFGSNALGNNPTANGGLIINEIMAFATEAPVPAPEPTAFALLGLGLPAIVLARRRRTRQN